MQSSQVLLQYTGIIGYCIILHSTARNVPLLPLGNRPASGLEKFREVMTFDIRRYRQCCIVFLFAFSSAGSSTQSSAQNKVTHKIYTMSDSISFYYRNYRISAEFFWAQDKYSAGSELTVNFEDKAVSCSQIPHINPHFVFPPKVGGSRGMLQGFAAVLSVWWSYVGISSVESLSDRNGWLIGRSHCGFQSDPSLEATKECMTACFVFAWLAHQQVLH